MGTRSLTRIMDGDRVLCCIYRQFDGYLEGHGKEIATVLASSRIVNGLSFRGGEVKQINGMGCLAAQLIAALKDGPGNVYVYPADACDQEWVYTISCDAADGTKFGQAIGGVFIRAESLGDLEFEGSPEALLKRLEDAA